MEWTKENLQEIVVFDFDNHSDILVVDYAIDLIDKADEVIIIFEVSGPFHLHTVTRFIHSLRRKKEKIKHLIINGQHKMIEKALQFLDKERIVKDRTIEIQQALLKDFNLNV